MKLSIIAAAIVAGLGSIFRGSNNLSYTSNKYRPTYGKKQVKQYGRKHRSQRIRSNRRKAKVA